MRAPLDASPAPSATESAPPVPVVCIGASAGGLDAIERFLRAVPAQSGMAYVVIQHLDPTQKAMLAPLLAHATPMPVVEATDHLAMEADRVYVIPPDRELSLDGGTLRLLPASLPRGLRLPIDAFLTALAAARGAASLGVILSGMGADGTAGAAAVKAAGGTILAQDPASAQFDSMPRSVIAAGHADVVGLPEELPSRLVRRIGDARTTAPTTPSAAAGEVDALEAIIALLHERTGHDFARYKRSTIERRIERRRTVHQLGDLTQYVRVLRDNPAEVDLLFHELLIGVTSFFRDPGAWEELRRLALPELLRDRPPGRPIRIWVPGCSTGEEAYSLAILFRETLASMAPAAPVAIQIFATDLDADAIDRARAGTFPSSIATDVSAERLARFFVATEDGYRISREIRETIVFAPQNVVMDPPFTRLDLVSCRNLLIYLLPDLQRSVLATFHFSLVPGGMLFLGNSETVGPDSAGFVELSSAARLYRRVDQGPGERSPIGVAARAPTERGPAARAIPMPTRPAIADAGATVAPAGLQALVEQVLLGQHTAPAVLSTATGDILYVSGRTARYLETPAGKANWNIFAMARDGLRGEIAALFPMASRRVKPVVRRGVTVRVGAEELTLDLTVQRLQEPLPLQGLMLTVITETAPAVRAKRGAATDGGTRLASALRDLERTREDLALLQAEMRATQQEASSAYEELQSVNEEAQSTNEELTTSREEMQSMNEELRTVNHELQMRMAELTRLNNDMHNLLDNTEITSVFLDVELRVRLFTAGSTRILKLIASDVGRPITDITSDLVYPTLVADAREVLRTLTGHSHEARTADGRLFRVRMMPYRTVALQVDGVVITYDEIDPRGTAP